MKYLDSPSKRKSLTEGNFQDRATAFLPAGHAAPLGPVLTKGSAWHGVTGTSPEPRSPTSGEGGEDVPSLGPRFSSSKTHVSKTQAHGSPLRYPDGMLGRWGRGRARASSRSCNFSPAPSGAAGPAPAAAAIGSPLRSPSPRRPAPPERQGSRQLHCAPTAPETPRPGLPRARFPAPRGGVGSHR